LRVNARAGRSPWWCLPPLERSVTPAPSSPPWPPRPLPQARYGPGWRGAGLTGLEPRRCAVGDGQASRPPTPPGGAHAHRCLACPAQRRGPHPARASPSCCPWWAARPGRHRPGDRAGDLQVEAGLRSAGQLERVCHHSRWQAVADRVQRAGRPPSSPCGWRPCRAAGSRSSSSTRPAAVQPAGRAEDSPCRLSTAHRAGARACRCRPLASLVCPHAVACHRPPRSRGWSGWSSGP
jgi:hypothetical protein